MSVIVAAIVALPQCSPEPPAPPRPPAAPVTTQAPVTVHPVSAEELGASWRPGCPVGPDELRRVEVDYVGFDGRPHRGEIIVNEDRVANTIEAFAELRRLGYPVDKVRAVVHYPGAEDELSMADNNTSAFNCRGIPGSSSWSEHAYGRAIDINPLVNPYISGSGAFEPHNAGPYLDRARDSKGMLRDGDPAVRVFTDRGWTWGGHWRSPKDYQHFELPVRR